MNALAFDLSANHLYQESYVHGKRSLQVALEGIHSVAEKEDNKLVNNLYILYKDYLVLPEEQHDIIYPENIKDVLNENRYLLKQIYNIPENDDAYIVS